MTLTFATISSRIKAVFVDTLLIVILAYLISETLTRFEDVPVYVRISLFTIIFVLYDPLFVSLFGATVGHSYFKIIVKSKKQPQKNISFFCALIRYMLRYTLGWISLLTISGNSEKRAIHDMAGGSIVLEE